MSWRHNSNGWATRPDGIFGKYAVSVDSEILLWKLGSALEGFNKYEEILIKLGKASGSDLDGQIVHKEQTLVQLYLDDLRQNNSEGYDKLIKEVNATLNQTGSFGQFASQIFPTDKAFVTLLDELRKKLGHPIDFANQADREAMGNAIIAHIRITGGCDIAGNRIQGCH
jgi:hypothetical protein